MPEMDDQYDSEIRNIIISKECIQEKLEKLNVNKSCGPDNIHSFVLRSTARSVSAPLEKIFNMSLKTGECPSDWRCASVTRLILVITDQ